MRIHIKNWQFDMLPVPGTEPGKPFMMGSDKTAGPDAYDDEMPAHPIHLSDFHMGQYPVTQALWRVVVEAECPDLGEAAQKKLQPEPSDFQGDVRPVDRVSWDDVQVFLKKLNLLTDESRPANTRYRLPTEAEWEYAARGGPHSEGYRYAGSDKLSEVGWFDDNSENEPHDVGLLMPNELGLYDMSGNVWEWCEDWFDSGYYQKCLDMGTVSNPKGPENGSTRVLRGGGWHYYAQSCRAACRHFAPDFSWPGNGFRLVLAPHTGPPTLF